MNTPRDLSLNPVFEALDKLRKVLAANVKPGRELSLVVTKLDEAELWLSQCQVKPDIVHAALSG